MYKEMFLRKKFVKLTKILLSGIPKEKIDAKNQCHPLSILDFRQIGEIFVKLMGVYFCHWLHARKIKLRFTRNALISRKLPKVR